MARSISYMVGACFLSSCAVMPDLPGDFSFPIQEIVRHAACEIRITFPTLRNLYGFRPEEWAVSIVLTPRSDTQVTGRGGVTGRNSLTNPFFNSWALGASPGAGLDLKGHRDGSVTYTIHTRQLLDPKFPINCENWSNAYHSLATNLGLREWLARIIAIPNGVDNQPLVSMEKPSFNSQIVIKFDGTGSFTYNFPLGTDFASLYGSSALDETLQISLAPDPLKKPVVTLPPGGNFGGASTVAARGISQQARETLNQMQVEQLLRNLQNRNNQ